MLSSNSDKKSSYFSFQGSLRDSTTQSSKKWTVFSTHAKSHPWCRVGGACQHLQLYLMETGNYCCLGLFVLFLKCECLKQTVYTPGHHRPQTRWSVLLTEYILCCRSSSRGHEDINEQICNPPHPCAQGTCILGHLTALCLSASSHFLLPACGHPRLCLIQRMNHEKPDHGRSLLNSWRWWRAREPLGTLQSMGGLQTIGQNIATEQQRDLLK